jgi:hypothetical protein
VGGGAEDGPPNGDNEPAVLDARSTAAHKSRLADLRDELAEAERYNDIGRAAHAREQIEVIATQLAAGLGGRERASGARAERARLAVTKRIKDALVKIRTARPELGQHLATSIRTGYFCVYHPERPVDWQL